MTRVAVVGCGQSPFGTRPETLRQLFVQAFDEAVASVDHGIDPERIEEAYVGHLGVGGGQIGNVAALVTDAVGVSGIPTRRVENACASSGFAFRDAVRAVASGACDVALAGGLETMNDLDRVHQRYWLGVSGDNAWERVAGMTFAGTYALIASRHMHDHGTTAEQLGRVAVKNHAHGAANPKAQFRKEVTLDKVLGSPMVAAPLHLYDCCPTTDGASVALVASEEAAAELTDAPVWVEASAAASDTLALHARAQLTTLDATRRAGELAFKEAGVGPEDVDVAELHDCFTIAEIVAYEDLGWCRPGRGGPFVDDLVATGDTLRFNPSGGLKAKGHPLGATGTGQVVELFHQLRGEAGSRQVEDARVGLAHNVGGSGATCTVHILTT